MADHDSPPQPGPAPGPRAPKRRRDLAEETGFLAGRSALGLTRLALRSKTVRRTLRNARDENERSD
ncbi:MAG: hypothetical protein ACREQM_00955 [Candidatus Dormibacteraceae bacterium]